MSVDAWIETAPIGTGMYSKLFIYKSYNLLFYLWKFTDAYDLVKLLLMYGANPDIPNYERTYYCHLTSRKLREERSMPVTYHPAERTSPSAMKILSLIYIRHAELCLQNEPAKQVEAIKYLQQSHQLSAEAAQEYLLKITQTKRGFAVNFNEEQMNCIIQTLSIIPRPTL